MASTAGRDTGAGRDIGAGRASGVVRLRVTQQRSSIGCKRNQRETLRTLGLRGIRKTVVREDDPQTRGMIATVRHLVTVEEVDAS